MGIRGKCSFPEVHKGKQLNFSHIVTVTEEQSVSRNRKSRSCCSILSGAGAFVWFLTRSSIYYICFYIGIVWKYHLGLRCI